MRRKISSWIRQARCRAKKHGSLNCLEIADVVAIVDEFDDRCAYCGAVANTLDHPFPLTDKAPNAPANVLPCCHECKTIKGTTNLIALFNNKHITKTRLLSLLRGMLARVGNEALRTHLKSLTGIGL